jgi:hypothetical protein
MSTFWRRRLTCRKPRLAAGNGVARRGHFPEDWLEREGANIPRRSAMVRADRLRGVCRRLRLHRRHALRPCRTQARMTETQQQSCKLPFAASGCIIHGHSGASLAVAIASTSRGIAFRGDRNPNARTGATLNGLYDQSREAGRRLPFHGRAPRCPTGISASSAIDCSHRPQQRSIAITGRWPSSEGTRAIQVLMLNFV